MPPVPVVAQFLDFLKIGYDDDDGDDSLPTLLPGWNLVAMLQELNGNSLEAR